MIDDVEDKSIIRNLFMNITYHLYNFFIEYISHTAFKSAVVIGLLYLYKTFLYKYSFFNGSFFIKIFKKLRSKKNIKIQTFEFDPKEFDSKVLDCKVYDRHLENFIKKNINI
jgi:hypothetical protein